MKATVITNIAYNETDRMSLPRSVWTGKEEIDTGLTLRAIYKRRNGEIVIETYSIFDDGTGKCVGTKYALLNDINFPCERVFRRIINVARVADCSV